MQHEFLKSAWNEVAYCSCGQWNYLLSETDVSTPDEMWRDVEAQFAAHVAERSTSGPAVDWRRDRAAP
jgi:hypothetical protein